MLAKPQSRKTISNIGRCRRNDNSRSSAERQAGGWSRQNLRQKPEVACRSALLLLLLLFQATGYRLRRWFSVKTAINIYD